MKSTGIIAVKYRPNWVFRLWLILVLAVCAAKGQVPAEEVVHSSNKISPVQRIHEVDQLLKVEVSSRRLPSAQQHISRAIDQSDPTKQFLAALRERKLSAEQYLAEVDAYIQNKSQEFKNPKVELPWKSSKSIQRQQLANPESVPSPESRISQVESFVGKSKIQIALDQHANTR